MLTKDYVILDVDCNTRDDALKAISEACVKFKIIDVKDKNNLFKAFLKRETESTTGFQDGFAIPHARIKGILKPAVIFMRFKKGINWPSLDNKATKIAIAILIPEAKAATMHMDALSKLSVLIMDKKFRDTVLASKNKDEIYKFLSDALNTSKKPANKPAKKKTTDKTVNIVGISACATGVVHTYMAKEALEQAGVELNWNVKIETQGQKGIETGLTAEDIAKADAVVIAADIYVELDRFNGKRLIKMNSNDAINEPIVALKESLDAKVYGAGQAKSVASNPQNKFSSSKVKTFMGHLLTGVSRMIPFIVFSGIVWAIINSVGQSNSDIANDPIYKIFVNAASVGFTVFIAIMGGFIAESIAGRAGLAPGFIATFVAADSNFYFWWQVDGGSGIPQIDSFFSYLPADKMPGNVGLSLFAAIMMGFAAGYLVKWVNSWKTHKLITPIMPIIFIPVVCSSVLVFPFIILLSGPMGYIMNALVYGLSEGAKINGVNFLIGFILGVMIGFDMGGPVNKIAGTTATALISIDPRLMGAVASAIPVAPLGCGIATIIAYKLFTEKERAEGISAIGLGFFGISEGAIPFAVNRPKKVLIANMIGSGIAAGLAFLFYVGGYVGMWGGPITAIVGGVHTPIEGATGLAGVVIPDIFGGAGNGMQYIAILWFFLAIAVGTLIQATILIITIKFESKTGRDQILAKWENIKNKIGIKTVNKIDAKAFKLNPLF